MHRIRTRFNRECIMLSNHVKNVMLFIRQNVKNHGLARWEIPLIPDTMQTRFSGNARVLLEAGPRDFLHNNEEGNICVTK